MKKKTMAFVMSLLMIVALVGVGFATWIITSTTTEETTGNVTVDTVVDATIGITPTWKESKSTIHFGAPAEQATPGAWLVNNSKKTEVLSVTLSLALTGLVSTDGAYGLSDEGIVVSVSEIVGEAEQASDGKYFKANAKKYVADLPADQKFYLCKQDKQYFLSTTSGDPTYDSGTDVAVADGAATLEVTITFKWGAAFGGNNPYTYFADKTATDGCGWDDTLAQADPDNVMTYKEFALTALKALEALNDAKFKATITATSAALA